jgi:taurine dioxygenase
MSTTATAAAIGVLPSGDALGADITGIDLRAPLGGAALEALLDAWTQHLVLRFRGQHGLTLDALIAFSRRLGTLDARPIASAAMGKAFEGDYPEITVISNVVVDGKPIGGLGAYESVWHADMTYNPLPPKASALYAVEIPPTGGDTQFANMERAYETLPEATRRRIESLTCVHDASRNSAGQLRLGYEDIDDPRRTVGAVHPVVRRHPVSGRRSLFLGRRRNAYLSGLPLEESEALLDALWAHASRPEFAWTQVWQLGDLVLWDNRCTMHRRDGFDPSTRRLLWRTQVTGEPVLS